MGAPRSGHSEWECDHIVMRLGSGSEDSLSPSLVYRKLALQVRIVGDVVGRGAPSVCSFSYEAL